MWFSGCTTKHGEKSNSSNLLDISYQFVQARCVYLEKRGKEEVKGRDGQIMRGTKKEERKIFIVTRKVTYLQVLCTKSGSIWE